MFTAFTHDSEAGAVQLPYEQPYKNTYQRQSGQYLVSCLQKASNKKKKPVASKPSKRLPLLLITKEWDKQALMTEGTTVKPLLFGRVRVKQPKLISVHLA